LRGFWRQLRLDYRKRQRTEAEAMAKGVVGRICLWLLSFSLICGLWRWMVPLVVCRWFSMEVAPKTRLEQEWQGKVRVIAEEELITAPAAGKVTLLVQEGQWVAPGSILAEISSAAGEAQVIYSPYGGIAAFGIEANPAEVGWNLGGRRRQASDGEQLAAGDGILRIIRPNCLHLGIERLTAQGLRWDSFIKFWVRETAREGSGSGRAPWYPAELRAGGMGDHQLRLVEFPREWLQQDALSVTVRMEGPEGARVPAAAVVTRRGEAGGTCGWPGRA
jgi:hypothetical protein